MRAIAQADRNPRLAVIGPLPPPVHGVTVSTNLVLQNPRLHERFEVVHVDTSDHRSGENIGRWEVRNLQIGFVGLARLFRATRGRRAGLVYLPISQNSSAFLRDSLFILLASARRWPVAVHLRGSDFPRFYRQSGRALRAWIRFTMARISSAGVMGHGLRFVFADMVAPERVAVVSNGTPDPGVTARPRESQRVLFLSNLRPRKGVEEAIAAARLVRARLPDVVFDFVGDALDEEYGLRVRAATAADSGIRFHPQVTGHAKSDLLASCAALLFCPIEPEGHPRVVLEAIAAGLPVVATDQGAIAETVIDGEGGFVLTEPDPALLADRLVRLLEDPDLRDQMGAAARRRYESTFSQERADLRLADWLSELWGQPGRLP